MQPSLFKKKKSMFGENDYQMLDESLPPLPIQVSPSRQQNQDVEEAPIRKPSLFNRNTEQAPSVDEYGLQIPKEHKTGLLSKILQVALPAATGLAGGVGILPGLMSGYLGMKAGENYQGSQDLLNYQKLRQQNLEQGKLDATLGLNRDKLSEEMRHNKASEGIGWTNATKPPAQPKVSDQQKALDIETRYRLGKPTSEEERAFLKSYYRMKNTKSAEKQTI
jgi:hypothetical protein